MWKFIRNKGFTLIELLISITILSIVLISFFTFFTSTFRVNSMNSNDIQAMNVAREYKELIRKDGSAISIEINNWSQNTEEEHKENFHKTYKSTDYNVTITVSASEETSAAFPIHRAHIEVKKDGKVLSETYTYYEPEETSSQ